MRVPLTLSKMETDTFKARVTCGNVSHAQVNRGFSAPEPQSVGLERYPTVPVSPMTQHFTVLELFNPNGY